MQGFTFHLVAAIPSVVIFFGITYWLMISRPKIKVSGWMALAHAAGIGVILAIFFTPARPASPDSSMYMVITAIVLSVVSCLILKGSVKSEGAQPNE